MSPHGRSWRGGRFLVCARACAHGVWCICMQAWSCAFTYVCIRVYVCVSVHAKIDISCLSLLFSTFEKNGIKMLILFRRVGPSWANHLPMAPSPNTITRVWSCSIRTRGKHFIAIATPKAQWPPWCGQPVSYQQGWSGCDTEVTARDCWSHRCLGAEAVVVLHHGSAEPMSSLS